MIFNTESIILNAQCRTSAARHFSEIIVQTVPKINGGIERKNLHRQRHVRDQPKNDRKLCELSENGPEDPQHIATGGPLHTQVIDFYRK